MWITAEEIRRLCEGPDPQDANVKPEKGDNSWHYDPKDRPPRTCRCVRTWYTVRYGEHVIAALWDDVLWVWIGRDGCILDSTFIRGWCELPGWIEPSEPEDRHDES